ncbi:MAG: tetratricopeptide repeat protein, partial [Rhodobacteraceae bacterium]|nr:tetratricopeptide repeat protein [Paracoccaceae bacterium]
YGGEPERAFAHLELARQLDPANFATIEDHLAVAYFSMERFTEAVEHGENALAATPENTFVIKVLAAAFGLMGEHSKAVSMVERLNAIRQSQHKRNYSVQTIDYNKAWWFFRRDEDTARLRDGLLKAGVH